MAHCLPDSKKPANRVCSDMDYILAFIFIFGIGGVIGWSLGWNAACRLYRDRAIERAEQTYEQDRV